MSQTPTFTNFTNQLTRECHDRDIVGLRYVYPVLSRRAGGVSIGVNLNPNNACNWRCVYCQVPGLKRGRGPELDLELLENELRNLVDAITAGRFLEQHVSEQYRTVKDFALSGNGEPTTSPQFAEALEVIGRVRDSNASLRDLPIVLITNGSLADRQNVQRALARLAELNGVVWFKLDRGSDHGLRQTNSTTTKVLRHVARLEKVARICPTFIQSCWFRRNHENPSPDETSSYLDVLAGLHARAVPIQGVQLYTIARQPQQSEATALEPVTSNWLEQLGDQIRALHLPVTVSV
jgi:wyosine [tRNA(Phe)-imidazoG37] synthetase (radical SAM superfamily)